MQVNFNDYFYYDETSPSCLRWKVDVFNKDGKRNRAAQKDKQAGGVNGIQEKLDKALESWYKVFPDEDCEVVHTVMVY